MAGYAQGRPKWMDVDFYPVAERVGKDLRCNDTSTIIVDVGGGMGHDLRELKAKHPNLRSRLVLQDLPETINEIEHAGEGIEATVHGFLTPQPIRGKFMSHPCAHYD